MKKIVKTNNNVIPFPTPLPKLDDKTPHGVIAKYYREHYQGAGTEEFYQQCSEKFLYWLWLEGFKVTHIKGKKK